MQDDERQAQLEAILEREAERDSKLIYCTHGQHKAPLEGGKWKPTANGRARFICAACITKHNRWKT